MTTFKTPGVYVQELSLFPPSVAEVATAVPAFVGYTRFAAAANGDSLKFQPVKIKSLLEFESLFGKGFTPGEYKVFIKSAGSSHIVDKVTTGIRFYLYDALRLFYDNGGGECYIVSVGFFDEVWKYDEATKIWSGTGISSADILKGLQLLTKFDEPTLLLFPDAAGIAGNDRFSLLGELQQAALAQASQLKDRFVIMDLMDGFLPAGPVFDPAETFRQYTGMNGLSYGAAYYPWLKMVKDADLSWPQLSFRKMTGNVESAFDTDTVLAADTVYGLYIARKNDLKSISDKIDLLKNGEASIGARLAALATDIAGTADDTILKAKLTEYFKVLSDSVLFLPQLETMAGADLKKVLSVLKVDLALQEAIRKLISLQKSNKITAVLDNNTAAAVTATYGVFATPNPWTGNIKFSDITADATVYVAGEQAKVVTALASAGVPARLEGVLLKLLEEATLLKSLGEKALLESHPLFKSASDQVKEMMRLVPPSGAVAGIYAATDSRRGVWKAPANVSIASVIGPAVRIDNRDQESLNVHTTGKSINAIRCFTGKGTLVWGARTLAGNDGEWKYIPVRRFFNMVEESVKKASEPFTFEPNDKNTWVKVKAMIENYLILQWRAGALQGANPADAFFVHVGFGETMTAEDILEGRMIIEIGMAAVRPAEFIVLRFSHKMLEGNA